MNGPMQNFNIATSILHRHCYYNIDFFFLLQKSMLYQGVTVAVND